MGASCSHCGSYGIKVGNDFRVPKKNDIKAWNNLIKERSIFGDDSKYSLYLTNKYTHNCGGG
jgi:hypothetical protein